MWDECISSMDWGSIDVGWVDFIEVRDLDDQGREL